MPSLVPVRSQLQDKQETRIYSTKLYKWKNDEQSISLTQGENMVDHAMTKADPEVYIKLRYKGFESLHTRPSV